MKEQTIKERIVNALEKAICDYGCEEYFSIVADENSDYIVLVTDIDVAASWFRDLEDAYLVMCQMLEEVYPNGSTDAVQFITTGIQDGEHEKKVLVFNINVKYIPE